jgi:hypothetical protein
MLGGRGDHRVPTLLARDIEPFEPRLSADCFGDLSAFPLKYIGDHDLGAFPREEARRGRPHAGCSTGDDRYFVR